MPNTTDINIPKKTRDPRFQSVQISIRMPWYYREQLEKRAEELGVTLPVLVLGACQKLIKPEAPQS